MNSSQLQIFDTEPHYPAPRVTEADVDAAIRFDDYQILRDGRTTICTLTLDNGFSVRGESSCVSIANFDADVGQRIAYKNAREKVWQLLGFRLADRLYAEARA